MKAEKMLYKSVLQRLHYLRFSKAIEAKIVAKFLEPKKGERILDIACGNGIQCMKLARRGCEVNGIDMSEAAIKVAKIITKETKCNFQIGNAEFLPYQSSLFDKILCVCSLEHFEDDEKALGEMGRVLKPSGTLVLTVDSFTYKGIENHLREIHKNDHRVVNYYSRSQLKERMENAGFNVVESKYSVNSPISSFFFRIGIKGKFGYLYKMLFPLSYSLSILLDRFWGSEDGGCLLAVKATKGSFGFNCPNSGILCDAPLS